MNLFFFYLIYIAANNFKCFAKKINLKESDIRKVSDSNNIQKSNKNFFNLNDLATKLAEKIAESELFQIDKANLFAQIYFSANGSVNEENRSHFCFDIHSQNENQENKNAQKSCIKLTKRAEYGYGRGKNSKNNVVTIYLFNNDSNNIEEKSKSTSNNETNDFDKFDIADDIEYKKFNSINSFKKNNKNESSFLKNENKIENISLEKSIRIFDLDLFDFKSNYLRFSNELDFEQFSRIINETKDSISENKYKKLAKQTQNKPKTNEMLNQFITTTIKTNHNENNYENFLNIIKNFSKSNQNNSTSKSFLNKIDYKIKNISDFNELQKNSKNQRNRMDDLTVLNENNFQNYKTTQFIQDNIQSGFEDYNSSDAKMNSDFEIDDINNINENGSLNIKIKLFNQFIENYISKLKIKKPSEFIKDSNLMLKAKVKAIEFSQKDFITAELPEFILNKNMGKMAAVYSELSDIEILKNNKKRPKGLFRCTDNFDEQDKQKIHVYGQDKLCIKIIQNSTQPNFYGYFSGFNIDNRLISFLIYTIN